MIFNFSKYTFLESSSSDNCDAFDSSKNTAKVTLDVPCEPVDFNEDIEYYMETAQRLNRRVTPDISNKKFTNDDNDISLKSVYAQRIDQILEIVQKLSLDFEKLYLLVIDQLSEVKDNVLKTESGVKRIHKSLIVCFLIFRLPRFILNIFIIKPGKLAVNDLPKDGKLFEAGDIRVRIL